MKELTAAFQSEVFRPIVTLVVPGFFSTFNLGIILWQRFPGLPDFAERHSGLATTAAVLAVLTVGLICEDLGARLEMAFDKRLARVAGYQQHYDEWFDYLRLAFEREPVGHRYLRTLVLRLKFELGMAVASVPFTFFAQFVHLHWPWRVVLTVAGIVGFFLFSSEAKATNKTLSELRREILKGQKEPPKNGPI